MGVVVRVSQLSLENLKIKPSVHCAVNGNGKE